MTKMDRRAYAEMFGPTTGDRVRLGDTELIIEVEAWLIEQPWPAIFTSRTVSVAGSTSRYNTTSSPHNGLKPSTLCAGGTGNSPRFRGER